MEKYMRKEYIIFLKEEFTKVVVAEDKFRDEIKGKTCGTWKFMFDHYSKECKYVFLMANMCAMTFFNIPEVYPLLFMVKNEHDQDEIQTARLMISIWFIIQFLIGMANLKYRWNKYRKSNFLFGVCAMGISWIACCISYSQGSYWFAKFHPLTICIVNGFSLVTTFYTMTSEICDPLVASFCYGTFLVGNSVISLLSPFWCENPDNLQWYSLSVGLLTLILFTLGIFGLIETQGLEKKDIYDILRGKTTRKIAIEAKRQRLKDIKANLIEVQPMGSLDDVEDNVSGGENGINNMNGPK